jgi:hypothetical protein
MKAGRAWRSFGRVNEEGLLIGLAVLAWLLWRQLQVRELRRDRGYLVPAVLVIVGVVEIASYGKDHPLGAATIGLLGLSAVVAAGLGALRAGTVRLWFEDGRLLRQGTYLTAALWLVAIAVHLGGDRLIAPHDADRIGAVSLLLYLGVSLAVQRAMLTVRARRLHAAGFA